MMPGLKNVLKKIVLGTIAASALMAGPLLTPSPDGALSGTPRIDRRLGVYPHQ